MFQHDVCIMGEETDNSDIGRSSFSSFQYLGEEFKIGDHVYLAAESFKLRCKPAKPEKVAEDETRYVRCEYPGYNAIER